MTKFVIVADLRTGSTLLSSSLNRHPRVHCYGELFHPDVFPDNVPPACDRDRSTARELIDAALAADDVRSDPTCRVLEGALPATAARTTAQVRSLRTEAAGFRAMVFLPMPSHPQWRGAWRVLRNLDDLRVVYLTRRDELAQYASIVIAQRAQSWHPSPGDPILDPENRPQITIDPREFRRWTRQRERLFVRRRRQLAGKPSLELDYETLTTDWPETIRRVQQFLGVDPVPLEQAKQKQERRPLADVITNYDELSAKSAFDKERNADSADDRRGKAARREPRPPRHAGSERAH